MTVIKSRERVVIALTTLPILLVTLFPRDDPSIPLHSWGLCLACGDFGGVDFLLNVALFGPLGLALHHADVPLRRTALVAFGLTLGIEAFQFLLLPGRFAALGDLVANTSGGVLGWILGRTWPLIATPAPAMARRLAVVSLSGVALIFVVTGWLLQPSLPLSTWFGQWRPELGQFDHFAGTVDSARLGPRPLPGHMLVDTWERRLELREGGGPISIRAHGTLGPPPQRTAPIVSVFDDRQRQVALLGQEGEDLVVAIRLRTADARLRTPVLRVPGGLAAPTGTRYDVAGWWARGTLTGTAVGTGSLPLTIGLGWSFVLPFGADLEPGVPVWNFLWLALLGFLPGRFAGRGWSAAWAGVIGVGVLVGMALVVSVLWTLPLPSFIELSALPVGHLLGWASARRTMPSSIPSGP